MACSEKYRNMPEGCVVINELLPVNDTIVADQNGEYDDWIELFNMCTNELDLSGYYLSDSRSEPDKWQIPQGTIIEANGFLIFWADGDTLQTGLHCNFKLSSAGETLYFLNPEKLIIDEIEYDANTLQESYSRKPDGTGSFFWQAPTFNSSNN
jgi:hypothetical protein